MSVLCVLSLIVLYLVNEFTILYWFGLHKCIIMVCILRVILAVFDGSLHFSSIIKIKWVSNLRMNRNRQLNLAGHHYQHLTVAALSVDVGSAILTKTHTGCLRWNLFNSGQTLFALTLSNSQKIKIPVAATVVHTWSKHVVHNNSPCSIWYVQSRAHKNRQLE